MAFDGQHIFVSNLFDDTLTKLRASDGTVVGVAGSGGGPKGVAFDGANIWVTNSTGGSVSKL